jgi:homoaconitate hydratase
MGLFNIKLDDDAFYAAAQEDSVITIDKDAKTIRIDGVDDVFSYQQSQTEETLLDSGGVLPLYGQFGRKVFRHITMPKVRGSRKRKEIDPIHATAFSGGGEVAAEEFKW